jgi:hypothetical protein
VFLLDVVVARVDGLDISYSLSGALMLPPSSASRLGFLLSYELKKGADRVAAWSGAPTAYHPQILKRDEQRQRARVPGHTGYTKTSPGKAVNVRDTNVF